MSLERLKLIRAAFVHAAEDIHSIRGDPGARWQDYFPGLAADLALIDEEIAEHEKGTPSAPVAARVYKAATVSEVCPACGEVIHPGGQHVHPLNPPSIKIVDGIEGFGWGGHHPSGLETDVHLKRCPFCDSLAALRRSRGDPHWCISVECSNTSCGVRTPEHYATDETAIAAWNRRAPTRP